MRHYYLCVQIIFHIYYTLTPLHSADVGSIAEVSEAYSASRS
jgi:hypothetical protein